MNEPVRLDPEAVQRLTAEFATAVGKMRATVEPGVARAAETMRQLRVELAPPTDPDDPPDASPDAMTVTFADAPVSEGS